MRKLSSDVADSIDTTLNRDQRVLLWVCMEKLLLRKEAFMQSLENKIGNTRKISHEQIARLCPFIAVQLEKIQTSLDSIPSQLSMLENQVLDRYDLSARMINHIQNAMRDDDSREAVAYLKKEDQLPEEPVIYKFHTPIKKKA